MRRNCLMFLASLFAVTGVVSAQEPGLDGLIQDRKVHQVMILNGPSTTITYFKRAGLTGQETDLVNRAAEERFVQENYRPFLPNQTVPATLEVRHTPQQPALPLLPWLATTDRYRPYQASSLPYGQGWMPSYSGWSSWDNPWQAGSQTTYEWKPAPGYQLPAQAPPSLAAVQSLVSIHSPASGSSMASSDLYRAYTAAAPHSGVAAVSFGGQEIGKGKAIITLRGTGEKITGTITNRENGWVTIAVEEGIERIRESEIVRVFQASNDGGVKPAGGPK